MERQGDTLSKVLLAVGFFAVSGAVAVAYAAPASQYELSIYAGTPPAFWAGIAVATVAALAVALLGRGTIRGVALALGGGAFVAVLGLPILRNYHFYGVYDALTHLGWTRGLLSGQTDLVGLLYPGIHTFAAFVGELTGYPLRRSMLLVVFVFTVMFFVFVPLCAWALTRDVRAVAVAAFSAFMLLPITNISSQLVAHPVTQTVMFLPLVLYLLVRYLRTDSEAGLAPTASGTLLAVALVAVVLYHPQEAVNLLLVFAAVVAIQFVARWRSAGESPVAATRPLYAQTAVLATTLAVWVPGHARFQSAVDSAILKTQELLAGQLEIASDTAQRGASLAEIGSGIVEIFLKLFAVPALYGLVAGLLLAVTLTGRLDDERAFGAFNRFALAGLVPVGILFVVYFVLNIGGTQAFRHLAFILVVVTVLGAIGIAKGSWYLSRWLPNPARDVAFATVFVLVLAVSVVAVFPSPWLYLHNQHVTEMQMSGYESTLEYTEGDDRILGVRSGPDRYADAYNERLAEDSRFGPVNETAMSTDLSESEGTGWYLTMTRMDYEREVLAYEELRYSAESFTAARTQQGVNRVIDTGEFDLYYVSG